MPIDNRTKVLWKGSRGGRGAGLEFTRRDLALEIIQDRDISDADFMAARGIVYAFGERMLSEVRETVELTARKGLNHGLEILVLASEDEIMRHAQNEMSKLGIAAYIHTRTGDAKAVPDYEIAQLMLMADAKMRSSLELELSLQGDFKLLEIDELPAASGILGLRKYLNLCFGRREDGGNLHGSGDLQRVPCWASPAPLLREAGKARVDWARGGELRAVCDTLHPVSPQTEPGSCPVPTRV